MTVAKLLTLLANLDPDAEILVHSPVAGFGPSSEPVRMNEFEFERAQHLVPLEFDDEVIGVIVNGDLDKPDWDCIHNRKAYTLT
jgi:hypothetical protein